MPVLEGLLERDGVVCSYRLLARPYAAGVELTAIMQPVLGGTGMPVAGAVAACAQALGRNVSDYVGSYGVAVRQHGTLAQVRVLVRGVSPGDLVDGLVAPCARETVRGQEHLDALTRVLFASFE